VLEPLQDLRMTVAAAQDFDRDRAARKLLLRRVDHAHAARADRVQHEESAEPCARLQRTVHRRHVERWNPLRIEKVVVRGVERGDQVLDVAAQRGVGAAAFVQEGRALVRVDVGHRQEDRLGRRKGHRESPESGSARGPSALNSHARA
jgi:hypothetical protein